MDKPIRPTLHHLTFVVRSLEESVPRWRSLLGDPVAFEDLPARGVRTARFALGGSWVVLVEPTGADGVPAEHLARHGEGLLLMSVGVESLDAVVSHLASEGIEPSGPRRAGLQGWQLQDLARGPFNGVQVQLCAADPSGQATQGR